MHYPALAVRPFSSLGQGKHSLSRRDQTEIIKLINRNLAASQYPAFVICPISGLLRRLTRTVHFGPLTPLQRPQSRDRYQPAKQNLTNYGLLIKQLSKRYRFRLSGSWMMGTRELPQGLTSSPHVPLFPSR